MKKALLFLTSCFLFGACEAEGPNVGWSDDPRHALNPQGKAALAALESDEEVDATVAWAAIKIDFNRAKGVSRFVNSMQNGIDPSQVEAINRIRTINDDTIGQDLPEFTPSQFLEYEHCPPLAPENNAGTDCDQMVDVVLARIKEDVRNEEIQIEQSHGAELGEEALSFMSAWAVAAQLYGAEVAAVHAKHELQAANQCDDKTNAHTVARHVGVKQGIEIVKSFETWSIKQVEDCVVNTDIIALQVEKMSMTEIKVYMEQHKVCEDVDINRTNEILIETEKSRKEGIVQGIKQQVTILKQKLYSLRKTLPCYCDTADYSLKTCGVDDLEIAKNGEGCWVDKGGWDFRMEQTKKHTYPGWLRVIPAGEFCCRVKKGEEVCVGWFGPEAERIDARRGYCVVDKDLSIPDSPSNCMKCDCKHRHVGSPLVVDLDDDGLTFADNAVQFDLQSLGSSQLTAWVDPSEAFLAIDLDGDGRVNSGAELFGNASDCDGSRCYDGVKALALWDSPGRGGNGDGRIDAHDEVFTRLVLWKDLNGDALSQPSELTAAHEQVVAIDLEADYDARQHAAGTVSARIEVLTKAGVRTAHDVWFRTKATLQTLFPRN